MSINVVRSHSHRFTVNVLLKMTPEPAVGIGGVKEIELSPSEVSHGCGNGLDSSRLRGPYQGDERAAEERTPSHDDCMGRTVKQ